jgi:site-specific DNA-methyltransferase (adenine-specific)
VTPYYSDDSVTIYLGEALNLLTAMEPQDIGAIIADPPYSSGGMFRSDRQGDPLTKYRGWSQAEGKSSAPISQPGSFAGDSRDQRGYMAWCSLWMSQLWRIAKPTSQLFVFTDWRQLPTTTDAMQAGGWTWRGLLVWDKGIGRPMKGRFRNHLEYIVWGSHGAMPEAVDGIYPSTLLKYAPPGTERVHVTEKPVALLRELVSIAPAGTILDPFMGSGTTLRAAQDLSRQSIGMEIAQQYCDIAIERLAQHTLGLTA